MGENNEEYDSVMINHSDAVFCVAISNNGKNVVSGGKDDTSYFWTINGSLIIDSCILKKHEDSVVKCCFTYDDKFVLVATMDGLINVFETSDIQKNDIFDGPSDEITSLTLNDYMLLVTSTDKTVWVYDLNKMMCLNVFNRHLAPVSCGDFLEEEQVATCDINGDIYIWNYKDLSISMKYSCLTEVNSIFTKQNAFLVGCLDGTGRLYSSNKSQVVALFSDIGESIESVGFCNNLKYIFLSSLDGHLSVFDASTFRKRFTIQLNSRIIKTKTLSKRPNLVSCLENGHIVITDYRSGNIIKHLPVHDSVILDFDISHDCAVLATAGEDSFCHLINL